jgi:hypothetical protein
MWFHWTFSRTKHTSGHDLPIVCSFFCAACIESIKRSQILPYCNQVEIPSCSPPSVCTHKHAREMAQYRQTQNVGLGRWGGGDVSGLLNADWYWKSICKLNAIERSRAWLTHDITTLPTPTPSSHVIRTSAALIDSCMQQIVNSRQCAYCHIHISGSARVRPVLCTVFRCVFPDSW